MHAVVTCGEPQLSTGDPIEPSLWTASSAASAETLPPRSPG
ncbi:hypothetical protein [Tessaracoccus coleopterorum]|nr:hypothetical protein [Tessaracoccus coleopterorum]